MTVTGPKAKPFLGGAPQGVSAARPNPAPIRDKGRHDAGAFAQILDRGPLINGMGAFPLWTLLILWIVAKPGDIEIKPAIARVVHRGGARDDSGIRKNPHESYRQDRPLRRFILDFKINFTFTDTIMGSTKSGFGLIQCMPLSRRRLRLLHRPRHQRSKAAAR
jgi:hypothetical protein